MKFLIFLTFALLNLFSINDKGNILVTGGNGYIGLSTCRVLKEQGYTPVSVDNSSNSTMPKITWGSVKKGDILNKEWLRSIFKKYKFVGIIHLAAKIYVPDSVNNPLMYYRENITGTINLLELAAEFGVYGIVFASTSAVYGILESDTPVSESQPLNPLSPYAETKLVAEHLLKFIWDRYRIPSAILRIFNVCGIDGATDNKDGHSPHLIPCLVKAFKKQPTKVEIFGTDYDTKDGTCLRDYVHVIDVAKAFVAALEYVLIKREPITANIGTGTGYSVREVAQAVSKYANQPYTENCLPRRSGDVPLVVADISKATQSFNWKPEHSTLENIVQSYYDTPTKSP